MCGVFSTLHPRYITTSGAGDALWARAFACAGRVTRETNSAGSWSRESTLTPRDMTPNAFCPAASRSASAFARFSSSRVIASMKRGFTPSSHAVRQAPEPVQVSAQRAPRLAGSRRLGGSRGRR